MDTVETGGPLLAIAYVLIWTIPFFILTALFIGFVVFLSLQSYTYECKTCHNKIKKNGFDTVFSVRSGFSKLLYCPVCKKKCWHKRIF